MIKQPSYRVRPANFIISLQLERSLWIEKFFLTKAVESNWLTGKYRKKETIYVSFRTVRELIWSERHLALVYGRSNLFFSYE